MFKITQALYSEAIAAAYFLKYYECDSYTTKSVPNATKCQRYTLNLCHKSLF